MTDFRKDMEAKRLQLRDRLVKAAEDAYIENKNSPQEKLRTISRKLSSSEDKRFLIEVAHHLEHEALRAKQEQELKMLVIKKDFEKFKLANNVPSIVSEISDRHQAEKEAGLADPVRKRRVRPSAEGEDHA